MLSQTANHSLIGEGRYAYHAPIIGESKPPPYRIS